ncbi:uncharacterized protein LOC128334939 [Hemicordylus capensis]|uniref:uncharacterized protein LOC128334939 n=1 Tax=Hemicordylus capensis TaxID=884348 RepID=UPI002302ACCC|nr:uncharacterized protein LOC128334939 [Hemicordylus capensis]
MRSFDLPLPDPTAASLRRSSAGLGAFPSFLPRSCGADLAGRKAATDSAAPAQPGRQGAAHRVLQRQKTPSRRLGSLRRRRLRLQPSLFASRSPSSLRLTGPEGGRRPFAGTSQGEQKGGCCRPNGAVQPAGRRGRLAVVGAGRGQSGLERRSPHGRLARWLAARCRREHPAAGGGSSSPEAVKGPGRPGLDLGQSCRPASEGLLRPPSQLKRDDGWALLFGSGMSPDLPSCSEATEGFGSCVLFSLTVRTA